LILPSTKNHFYNFMPSPTYIRNDQLFDALDDLNLAYYDGAHELDLSSKELTDEDIVELVSLLKIDDNITSLVLYDNYIGDDGAIALADLFKHNKNITKLNLQRNCIKDEGIIALTKELKKQDSVLESLYLDSNEIGRLGIRAISSLIRCNKTIYDLSLEDLAIDDRDAEILAKSLRFNKTITYFDLTDNCIKDRGVLAIADAIRCNQNLPLDQLFLGKNYITNKGARSLLNNFKGGVITLNDNNIEDAAGEVSGIVANNKNIYDIDLRGNKFTLKGVRELALAVKDNDYITSIYMDLPEGYREAYDPYLDFIDARLFVNDQIYEIKSGNTRNAEVLWGCFEDLDRTWEIIASEYDFDNETDSDDNYSIYSDDSDCSSLGDMDDDII